MRDGDPRESYDPLAIEDKWQRIWSERGTNLLTDEQLATAERPFYNLMMFPYPSAEGLHVGNMYAFTGADIHGRWKRLQGEDVFQPIGFDAFGIHSENFALRIGTHPMELIPKNVANFTRQLTRIGAMYDWSHTVDTTHPDYYRWTQWLFLKLYEQGLAEKKEAPVNWCPSCHTVLANEQVIGGACERCGTPVEQRVLSQWFFRITKYAQRLLDNLRWIDWSESTRKAQENWIGRSEGAEIRFAVTTPWRPAAGSEAAAAIERARSEHADEQSAWERRHGATGEDAGTRPEFEQQLAISAFTTRPDTIFGATYMVLAPEHPVVDWITTTERRAEIEDYRANVRAMDLVARKTIEKAKTGAFTGAYARNPATGRDIPIWIADYVLMEYGTGAIMAVPAHDERDYDFALRFGLDIPRVIAADDQDAATPVTEAYTGEGRVVNSGAFDGTPTQQARGDITSWLAGRGDAEARVNYRLHDWCISRQRYWGPPIPILYCDACGTVPVPEDELPVVLPFVDNYKPDESGVSPLARVDSWYRVSCPRCGGEARRETDVSDTFLDSAWYFLRYPSVGRDNIPFDPAVTRRWLPVNMYIGGEEHAVLHLLYSRFVTMALYDAGLIGFEEPFAKFRKHGLLIKDGSKMSKSRGNVVIPDEYIERWGADAFRTYLMFLGPYQEGGDFRDQSLQGPYRFLAGLWDSVVPVDRLGTAEPSGALEQKLHATIRKVTEDIGALRYNTAIAAMMEYLNVVREGGRRANRAEVEPLVALVAPFAPHLAEELWQRLGNERGLFETAWWPAYDEEKATADTVDFVVQVNGKVRARIPVARGTDQDQVQAVALADDRVARFLDGTNIRKIVFVPDRLINLVV